MKLKHLFLVTALLMIIGAGSPTMAEFVPLDAPQPQINVIEKACPICERCYPDESIINAWTLMACPCCNYSNMTFMCQTTSKSFKMIVYECDRIVWGYFDTFPDDDCDADIWDEIDPSNIIPDSTPSETGERDSSIFSEDIIAILQSRIDIILTDTLVNNGGLE